MLVIQRAHRPVGVMLIAVLAAALGVTATGTAEAVATVLFDQPFTATPQVAPAPL